MQTTSDRPNQVVDPEMYPGSQPPSKLGANVALARFILFPGAGALLWLAL